jgi:uncharacterized C2H2 Zn-finger protein
MVKCAKCGRNFRNIDALGQHYVAVHLQNSGSALGGLLGTGSGLQGFNDPIGSGTGQIQQVWKCPRCKFTANSKNAVKRHFNQKHRR